MGRSGRGLHKHLMHFAQLQPVTLTRFLFQSFLHKIIISGNFVQSFIPRHVRNYWPLSTHQSFSIKCRVFDKQKSFFFTDHTQQVCMFCMIRSIIIGELYLDNKHGKSASLDLLNIATCLLIQHVIIYHNSVQF